MLIISIILEAAVMAIAILAARDGRPYMYGLAFTFGAYVFYDLAGCCIGTSRARCCPACS